jgi:peptidoglycan glycosyltransferase
MTRQRSTELGLVLLAALLTAAAYTLVSLGTTASLPAKFGPFFLIQLGVLGMTHVGLRKLAPDADPVVLPLALLLNGIGYVFVARLDPDLAALQATWTALGVAAFLGTLVVVRRVADLERYRYLFMFAGIGLLLLPLVPGVGRNINGARIWVALGPIRFQPGEFAKIALAVFFASYLVERRELLADLRMGRSQLRYMGPLLLAWGVSLVVMIAERDLGSSLLFFALFVVMLWVATGRTLYLALGGTMFGAGALVALSIFGHVKQRIVVWIDPWSRSAESGFQLVQAQFALAAGGFAGAGLGLGSPQKLPAAETDLIFAVIGEELGLLGTSAVLVAFMLMVGAGLRIALRANRPFEQLLAAGLTTVLGVQAFIIIGGVTRLVPLTGVTLPFVSYGGSSLLGSYVLLALLVRISDSAARAEGAAPAAPVGATS